MDSASLGSLGYSTPYRPKDSGLTSQKSVTRNVVEVHGNFHLAEVVLSGTLCILSSFRKIIIISNLSPLEGQI